MHIAHVYKTGIELPESYVKYNIIWGTPHSTLDWETNNKIYLHSTYALILS